MKLFEVVNYVVKSVPSDSSFCVKFHHNVKSKDGEQNRI
jgi:hypothetical protein